MQNRVNKRGSCSLHAVCDNSIRLCCYFAASVFHCNGSVAKGRKQKAEKAWKTLSRLGIEPAFNATDVKGVLIPRISDGRFILFRATIVRCKDIFLLEDYRGGML